MCGIAGIIRRNSPTLGQDLINMLKELEHRGRDATGVALYEQREDIRIRASLTDPCYEKELEEIISLFGRVRKARSYHGEGIFSFYEGSIEMDPSQISRLHWDIDSHPQLCVHSLGQHLIVFKDQGSAEDLQKTHEIKVGPCTHGIGHVRLATESVENINFAHPFITYLFSELAIVHNGQFTNYFKMRRSLENKGVRFKTNNDSELAAHYLGYQMKEKGQDLEGAMHQALEAFDGVFTILASTDKQIGAFRDWLGFKPVLYFEREDGTVLFGSEQICLTPIVSDVYATEMEPGGVKVWSI